MLNVGAPPPPPDPEASAEEFFIFKNGANTDKWFHEMTLLELNICGSIFFSVYLYQLLIDQKKASHFVCIGSVIYPNRNGVRLLLEVIRFLLKIGICCLVMKSNGI